MEYFHRLQIQDFLRAVIEQRPPSINRQCDAVCIPKIQRAQIDEMIYLRLRAGEQLIFPALNFWPVRAIKSQVGGKVCVSAAQTERRRREHNLSRTKNLVTQPALVERHGNAATTVR